MMGVLSSYVYDTTALAKVCMRPRSGAIERGAGSCRLRGGVERSGGLDGAEDKDLGFSYSNFWRSRFFSISNFRAKNLTLTIGGNSQG